MALSVISALVDKYPDMKLIMAPTTVGIAAAAKAMTDEGLCDKVKVSGLGLPAEMVAYTKSGCAPEFALWWETDNLVFGRTSNPWNLERTAGGSSGGAGGLFGLGRAATIAIFAGIGAAATTPLFFQDNPSGSTP